MPKKIMLISFVCWGQIDAIHLKDSRKSVKICCFLRGADWKREGKEIKKRCTWSDEK